MELYISGLLDYYFIALMKQFEIADVKSKTDIYGKLCCRKQFSIFLLVNSDNTLYPQLFI